MLWVVLPISLFELNRTSEEEKRKVMQCSEVGLTASVGVVLLWVVRLSPSFLQEWRCFPHRQWYLAVSARPFSKF